jgi:hypothetical protein
MRKHISQISAKLILASITLVTITQTCWAGPPGPPVITAPLGGDEILIATTFAIASYGYWKSRR